MSQAELKQGWLAVERGEPPVLSVALSQLLIEQSYQLSPFDDYSENRNPDESDRPKYAEITFDRQSGIRAALTASAA
jgi:hypothetical protein